MFGLIKRSTHEAEVAGLKEDVRQAEAAADRLTAEVRQVREANETLRRWIAEERAAHKAAAAERDALQALVEALKPEVERARARRAKATANLKNQRRAA